MENESIVVVELSAFERDIVVKALLSVQISGTVLELAKTLETIEGIVDRMKDTEIPEPVEGEAP